MPEFVSSDVIRTAFSRAMSDMYRNEVPQYGTLMLLVRDVNRNVLAAHPQLKRDMERAGEFDRLHIERHGAIRLGTAQELADTARIFAVMGMQPVGNYDLSVTGVPVHSTAFRAVDEAALSRNPFWVFTSLLRLELIDDEALRAEAERILSARQIFTASALELATRYEKQGGRTAAEIAVFVAEVLKTFRWHRSARVSAATYKALHDAHRLIADVVSFPVPHINHLTPRTLDIDTVQAKVPECGITPKETIEGPPRRAYPILLRQTSFKALQEQVSFADDVAGRAGHHTARFGEIEQRGVALTPKGRALYDRLLDEVRRKTGGGTDAQYDDVLMAVFEAFPDAYEEMRRQGLGFFRYSPVEGHLASPPKTMSLDEPVAGKYVRIDPIIYEDFLSVSAAGIFQSNLQSNSKTDYGSQSNRDAFEEALGRKVHDEIALYDAMQRASIENCLAALGLPAAAAA
ncbi:VOC family protein [Devosia sp. 1566]|uniref:2-oxoadipate dioxygenase/decarboxylase HglS n=1 Tax=Devosia sp. 1566 TaxID=2499144 RepID=UPI000FDA4D72|nr:VOC family protein [Devosia sp. 1566]